jgi:transglutaminase-like putative cysteine protease
MSTPPLLLGAAMLFWGWQTGFLVVAAIIAVVLEGSRIVMWRWDLTRSDFYRVSNLCALLFVGMGAYLVLTSEAGGTVAALYILRQWMPFAALPLVAAQFYSTSGKMDADALLLFFRRKVAAQGNQTRKAVDLTYPYLVVLLLSASAANVRAPWFYVALCLLSAWALWVVRPRVFSPVLWVVLLATAGSLGYVGHVGLHNLQAVLEEKITQLYVDFVSGGETNPYQSTTAMGHIGTMKLSDDIVLRVEAGADEDMPILLHGASYNRYSAAAWFARDAGFDTLAPESDVSTWKLRPETQPTKSMTIAAYLVGGKGILALPPGTSEVEHLTVGGVKQNRLGAVQVEGGPGLVTYKARYARDVASEGPPDEADVRIPQNEAPVVSRIAAELGIAAQDPRQALQTVAGYFEKNFTYSLYQSDRPLGSTPLGDFFLRSKAGHCEYFATATVLLLRAAGIPARYATGYSVQEFSKLENLYIVRARHAHAWVRAYVDGAWMDVDTTPASWVAVESKAASRWESLSDLWAWVKFQYSKWRWGERGEGIASYLGWLLIPLILIVAWRLYFAKRVARAGAGQAHGNGARIWPGMDSEFYVLEKRMQDRGLGRHPWEPVATWLQRIKSTPPATVSDDALEPIIALHNRYRFDPHGLNSAEREALKVNAQSWLAESDPGDMSSRKRE